MIQLNIHTFKYIYKFLYIYAHMYMYILYVCMRTRYIHIQIFL